jgi:dihydrolipoamide dehydrogenase
MGVDGTNTPKLNWEQVEKHRRWVQTSRGEMALKADKGMKIDVREGYGEFVDAHTLKITPVEGEPYTVSFGAAVIATGAPAFVPPIPGARENLATGGVHLRHHGTSAPKKLASSVAQWRGDGADFQDFWHQVLMRTPDRIEDEIARTDRLWRRNPVVTGADIRKLRQTWHEVAHGIRKA